MARQAANAKKNHTKKKKDKQEDFAGGDGHDNSAQESEYRNLRKRVEARKDAKQILEIAKRIEQENH